MVSGVVKRVNAYVQVLFNSRSGAIVVACSRTQPCMCCGTRPLCVVLWCPLPRRMQMCAIRLDLYTGCQLYCAHVASCWVCEASHKSLFQRGALCTVHTSQQVPGARKLSAHEVSCGWLRPYGSGAHDVWLQSTTRYRRGDWRWLMFVGCCSWCVARPHQSLNVRYASLTSGSLAQLHVPRWHFQAHADTRVGGWPDLIRVWRELALLTWHSTCTVLLLIAR
jgi:hypothetical protein